jgi:hypothetical protein
MGNGRPRNTAVTFWRHVDERGPDECWPWKIATKNGYGRFSLNCVEHYAHRFAYALAKGLPPHGRETHVMHDCNNKLCCNPAHLVLGTAAQNTQDAYRDGLAASGEQSAKAKFSDAIVGKIKSDPRTQMEISRSYGISQSHVSRIKQGVSRG